MLVICEHCQGVIRSGEACPHCGGAHRSSRIAKGIVLMGLTVTMGCPTAVTADYGSAAESGWEDEDFDGDGYTADVDCDDGDETIHPDAEETPGDEVDSNCNGDDDT